MGDLYVTNVGPNALYRNRATERSPSDAAAARRHPLWSASCAFADLDRDGDLDLFVVNYVDPTGTRAVLRRREAGPPVLLPSAEVRPVAEHGVPEQRQRQLQRCDHRERDQPDTRQRLGVVIADFDDDRWPDVFVANDSLPNFLFLNEGGWRFTETALPAGVAVAPDGRPRAGMGIDAADYDGDGGSI